MKLNTTNLNIATFEGNLTDVPKLVHIAGGTTPVAGDVVLVNRRIKSEEGKWADCEPIRHRIKAWNQLAENLAKLPKGARVLVVGHTETDNWTDTQTQQKRTADIVVVEAVGASLRYTTVMFGTDAVPREEGN